MCCFDLWSERLEDAQKSFPNLMDELESELANDEEENDQETIVS